MHFAVAPVGSVLLAATVGADCDAEAVDFAAVVAAGDDGDCTPAAGGVAEGAEAPPADFGVEDAAGAAELVGAEDD